MRSLEQVLGLLVGFPCPCLSDILLLATTFRDNCNTNTGDTSGREDRQGACLVVTPGIDAIAFVALTVPGEITCSQVLVPNVLPSDTSFYPFLH